jgi:hypothetical protein
LLTSTAAEFAVRLIKDIDWNPTAFQNLEMPSIKKDIVLALAEANTMPSSTGYFDDFVAGKGRGLIVLLQ